MLCEVGGGRGGEADGDDGGWEVSGSELLAMTSDSEELGLIRRFRAGINGIPVSEMEYFDHGVALRS